MASYRATVPSSWTQAETFDYLADFRNVSQWDPNTDDSVLLTGSPGRANTRYRLTMSMLGRRTDLVYEALDVRRPECFAMRSESRGFTSVDVITVATDGAVTYEARLELRGLRRILDPLVQRALTRASEKARASLQEILARLAPRS